MTFTTFLIDNRRWLAAGALLTFISSFGQTYFISIFAGQIMADYGLSDGDWGTLYFAGTLVSGLLMIWAGALADSFRARMLAMVVMFGLIAVCLAMAGNAAVWLLPFIVFGLRFTGQGMLHHIAIVAMARWYVRARGKAIAIASLGFAFGEACLPVIFVAAMGVVDWRWLWVLAAILTGLAIPVLAWLLKAERVPGAEATNEAAAGMRARHWTRADALRDWRFWGLVPLATVASTFGTALFFQQVHLAEVKGWSHVGLVALFPVFTVTAILVGLVSGVVLDRFGAVRLWWLAPLPMAVGFWVLSVGNSILGAGVAFFFIGLAQGMNATIGAAFWAETYGTNHVGAIKALATALMVIGSAIGPVLTGWLIDAGVSFPEQMGGIAIYLVAVSAWSWVVTRSVSKEIVT